MDENTELPEGYEAYCPKCKYIIDREEIMPVVCLCTEDKKGNIKSVVNRAFHFPNCLYGTTELIIRPQPKEEIY